jgi:hypothetical protein
MNAPSDLMLRARRALESVAAASLALAPLAMQPAQAGTLGSGDLTVDQSGAYFYNSSGYFAYWNAQPVGAGQSTANADGSTKLFGTVSATPEQFLAHQCGGTYGCSGYQDRGVALVWSGTLASPAAVGDRLAITVDFNVTLPDVGGSWTFGAQLADYNVGSSNSLPYDTAGSTSGNWISEAGTYHVQGVMLTDPLTEYQVHADQPTYWKVFVTGTASTPYNEGAWSDAYGTYMTPYRGVTLTVPQHSIDVAHVDANYVFSGDTGLTVTAVVPEPGTWGMLALGLGVVALRARRRA